MGRYRNRCRECAAYGSIGKVSGCAAGFKPVEFADGSDGCYKSAADIQLDLAVQLRRYPGMISLDHPSGLQVKYRKLLKGKQNRW